MCLLVVASPNSTPSRKSLEVSACSNPHGFGYAIIANGKIITNRGMSAKKMINEFLALREKYPDGYAMFHARYATHGVKNESNCHPFQVGGREDTYLAHNGVLDIKINNGDKRSDTRVFAEDTLPSIGGVSALDDDNVFKMVSKWAMGSKIAIFTLDPRAKYDCYIINEDAGHWDNFGCWWSNNSYQASGWSTYLDMPNKESEWDETEFTYEAKDCELCGAYAIEDANPYYCEQCLSCFECGGVSDDTCFCWAPQSNKWKYEGTFGF